MNPVVRVTGGLVRGSSNDGVSSFLGIPYAAAAVGIDRYRAPRPVDRWDGVRDALAHGPTPSQAPYPPQLATILPSSVRHGDEYLNVSVWSPSEADGLPVMVWLPGGAFVRGANSVATYDGRAFARDGVVVVAVNYRLGVPGFAVLEGAPTNLGIRDQVAALEWVRDNVAAFGGNPDDVTVFGESAGGMSVATLMASPAGRGLFHRAIIQSGSGAAACSLDDARKVSAEVAVQLGVPATAEAFGAQDPEAVLAAQSAVGLSLQTDPDPQRWGPSVIRGGQGIMSFFPVVDGELLPDLPETCIAGGSAAGVPLLIGTTRDEFRLFLVPTGVADGVTAEVLPLLGARYGWTEQVMQTYAGNRSGASAGDLLCAVLTDLGFRVPSARLAAAQSAWASVHAYEFAWSTPVAGLGACHGLELPFVFDTLRIGALMAGDAAPQHLADEMHGAWVAFGRHSEPGWRPWTPDDPAVMVFDEQSRVVVGPRADELAVWG